MLTIAILLVIGGLVAYIIVTYNNLVSTKKQIKASIQEIGNQLKRQANLIPNLTESVKGYLKHERGIFDKLTAARQQALEAAASGNLEAMGKASEAVRQAISPIKVIFESNPELKSQEVVKSLMDNLRDTADKVTYSRRLLIDLVADFNTKISTFPGLLLAKLFGFKEEKGLKTPETGEHVEVDVKETKAPKVKL